MFCYTAAGPYNGRRNDALLMQELVGSRSVGCNFLEGRCGEPTFGIFFASVDCLTCQQRPTTYGLCTRNKFNAPSLWTGFEFKTGVKASTFFDLQLLDLRLAPHESI